MPAQDLWTVPRGYDYSRSTERNYAAPLESGFVGRHIELRRRLDYTWHTNYAHERQLFQDAIIDGSIADAAAGAGGGGGAPPASPAWVVFTAGPMGAGKSHTMRWLGEKRLFPLESFVQVDPDVIRYKLPEMAGYLEASCAEAGRLTHKEAGLISELLVRVALDAGRNVLVDGSLRDFTWYAEYFRGLRADYPRTRIAIIHVAAPTDLVIARARARAERTGRNVPEDVLAHSLQSVPRSVAFLAPLADVTVHFSTAGGAPTLVMPEAMSLREFAALWQHQPCNL